MPTNLKDIIEDEFGSSMPPLFLVAVSGGRDSMSLVDMCRVNSIPINVLHCHFGLRDEADLETVCVKWYCKKHNIPIDVRYFNGKDIPSGHNIQEQCRKWRYQWFEENLNRNPGSILLTAHHTLDTIETHLLNMQRGAGLNGLKGIPRRRGRVFRPLINWTTDDITKYVEEHSVPFVHDPSNFENKYDRNFIRLEILSRLKDKFPQFENSAGRSMEYLREAHNFIQSEVNRLEGECLNRHGQHYILNWKNQAKPFILKEWLIQKGFNRSVISQILKTSSSGRIFVQDGLEMVTTREGYVFSNHWKPIPTMVIPKPGTYMNEKYQLKVMRSDRAPIVTDPLNQVLCISQDEFPLQLTPWQNGDVIRPLGMNGRSKKVSDLLSDNGVNQLQKRDVLVLKNKPGKVIWVVGHQISHTHRIKEMSSEKYELKINFTHEEASP